jgi:hypothetical protein
LQGRAAAAGAVAEDRSKQSCKRCFIFSRGSLQGIRSKEIPHKNNKMIKIITTTIRRIRRIKQKEMEAAAAAAEEWSAREASTNADNAESSRRKAREPVIRDDRRSQDLLTVRQMGRTCSAIEEGIAPHQRQENHGSARLDATVSRSTPFPV